MPEVLTEGWARPGRSNKFHYLILEEKVKGDRSSFSLCGNYGFFRAADALDPDNGKPSPDDCAPCRKKLNKRGVHNGTT